MDSSGTDGKSEPSEPARLSRAALRTMTDEQLGVLACEGRDEVEQSEAFHVLILRLWPTMVSWARHHGANEALADDVAIESAVRAWDHRCQFQDRGAGSYRGWLHTIVRNRTWTAVRKEGSSRNLFVVDGGDGDGAQPVNSASPGGGPAPVIDDSRERAFKLIEEAYQALARERPGTAAVLEFDLLDEGLTDVAIATKLGIATATVATRRLRGRDFIALHLARDGWVLIERGVAISAPGLTLVCCNISGGYSMYGFSRWAGVFAMKKEKEKRGPPEATWCSAFHIDLWYYPSDDFSVRAVEDVTESDDVVFKSDGVAIVRRCHDYREAGG